MRLSLTNIPAQVQRSPKSRSISNFRCVNEQWSRYRENRVDDHCSYGERFAILNKVERQRNEVEKSSPLDVV